MDEEGFSKFQQHHHAELWKGLDAKDPSKGYGVKLADGQWYWYQRWVDKVRSHCKENRDKYA